MHVLHRTRCTSYPAAADGDLACKHGVVRDCIVCLDSLVYRYFLTVPCPFVACRYERGKVLIFVHTKDQCDALYRDLLKHGYPCLSLHGGKDQVCNRFVHCGTQNCINCTAPC
jgi:hypothetical protein